MVENRRNILDTTLYFRRCFERLDLNKWNKYAFLQATTNVSSVTNCQYFPRFAADKETDSELDRDMISIRWDRLTQAILFLTWLHDPPPRTTLGDFFFPPHCVAWLRGDPSAGVFLVYRVLSRVDIVSVHLTFGASNWTSLTGFIGKLLLIPWMISITYHIITYGDSCMVSSENIFRCIVLLKGSVGEFLVYRRVGSTEWDSPHICCMGRCYKKPKSVFQFFTWPPKVLSRRKCVVHILRVSASLHVVTVKVKSSKTHQVQVCQCLLIAAR